MAVVMGWCACEQPADAAKKRSTDAAESKNPEQEAWRGRLKAAQADEQRWKADEKKHIEALNAVAKLYAEGLQKNYIHHHNVRSWCAAVAESGAGYSGETVIAALFLYGDGVNRDAAKAREWFEYGLDRPGRQRGNALYMLGLMYSKGDGVPASPNKAMDLWQKAADEEHPAALGLLGRAYFEGKLGLEKDIPGGVALLERAGNAGDDSSSSYLGRLYAKGQGVPLDIARAMKWYEQGASAGNAHCQYIVGLAYLEGTGVPVDETKAFNWLCMAAGQDHVNAMLYLSICYATGKGTDQNADLADVWKKKALQLNEQRQKEKGGK